MPEEKQEITKVEIGPVPEAAPEISIEKPKEVLAKEEAAEEAAPAVTVIPGKAAVSPMVKKDELTAQIEDFLAEDLLEAYAAMPPETQEEFKAKGEEVASKIQAMIRTAKVAVKDVLELIVFWLKIIPGVNKFFLEQEAKIKTDKILALYEEQKSKQI
ncbi:hypothetical protein HYT45_03415 [Candidatus Uhrbacteria bacterium]|nr:hypothetical protein [Candidatus Uhrbacteria bacterium]